MTTPVSRTETWFQTYEPGMVTENPISAIDMRALEQAAMASGTVTGLDLMERAGQGVVDAVLSHWPDFAETSFRAVVLCGPGNNGGDGFVVARLLCERGWDVAVFFYGTAEALPPDARINHDKWLKLGPVQALSQPRPTPEESLAFQEAASHLLDLQTEPNAEELPPFLLVDALFGIGLSRPLRGINDVVLHWDYLTNFPDLNDARIVAVDICSGLDSETGEVVWGEGAAFTGVLPASLTVTFHAAKPGHLKNMGPKLGGKLVVCDIGLRAFET